MTMQRAIENLKILFSNTSEDTISLQDAYSAAALNLDDIKKNRIWIANRLSGLKELDLVEPVYAMKGFNKILHGIKLTEQGKIALRGIDSNFTEVQRSTVIDTARMESNAEIQRDAKVNLSLEMLEKVSKLSQENRGVVYEIKLQEAVVSIHMP